MLTTVSANPRAKLQASALETAQRYEKQAIAKLRLLNLGSAELDGRKGQGPGLTGDLGLMEDSIMV